MISKDRNFSSYNYYSMQDFCMARFFQLDNPNPVERETISNIYPKNPNIRPDWTPKSGSCTPLLQIRMRIRVDFMAISWPISKNVAIFNCPGHEKTHLSIFWVCHCKTKFSLKICLFLYFSDGIHVTHCYSNTVALQPFIALKCVVMI